MNWSKCPIVFKGKQYHSISDCIKQTGCSRYVIKKNMTYVNQTDLNKFSNFGKKPNNFKTKPSKQKLESLYTGNIRELARKFSVSEKKIIDLLNEYNISLISLSDAKILKNDFKKPSRKILKEIYDNNSLLATAKYFKIGISKLKNYIYENCYSPRSRD